MTAETNLSLRSPWPDELARMWKFLGQSTFTGHVHPRIAVVGEPKRIVAASALEVNGANAARLYLFFRGRFCQPEVVDLFLQEAEETARREGVERMVLVPPQAAPWNPFLEMAGYTRGRSDEWWMISWSQLVRKRLQLAERLVRSPKLSRDFSSASPVAEDRTAIQAIASEHGLAHLERMGNDQILGRSVSDYSPELSRVVRWKGEVVGMLLVKDFGDRAFIHLRAVAKKHSAKSAIINAHFLSCFLQPAYKSVTRFIFSGQPTVEKETIAMARRFGGLRIGCFCQFTKKL